MTIALVSASILVLSSAGIAAWMLARRRQNAGADRLARTLHLNARWWKEQQSRPGELLYVALGDSAAQGVGASSPGRSYVGLIANHLRERTGGTVRVVNLSVSGARLADVIAVQLPELAQLKPQPDFMTMAIGANDIAHFDLVRFERELGIVFDALPGDTIVGDLPAFYLGKAEQFVRSANSVLHRMASERGFEIAEVYAKTRRQGAARYALNQVAADFFHPNDRGYRVWASAFLPLLDRRFPAKHTTGDKH